MCRIFYKEDEIAKTKQSQTKDLFKELVQLKDFVIDETRQKEISLTKFIIKDFAPKENSHLKAVESSKLKRGTSKRKIIKEEEEVIKAPIESEIEIVQDESLLNETLQDNKPDKEFLNFQSSILEKEIGLIIEEKIRSSPIHSPKASIEKP